ncbi:MAG: efflux RND transporter periplasmic adaptor subunit [Cyclobacteriaceae bacterium]
MKNLFSNSWVLMVVVLVAGVTLGWLIKPASTIEQVADHEHSTAIGEWTCSMHPQIRTKEPGACPICGMDLIPVASDGEDENPLAIRMSSNAMKLANIHTMKVGSDVPMKTVRLTGKVQQDERLIYTQSSHISGRIEGLSVNYTGENIHKGQVVATIYSPALVTAQQELFETYKIKESQPGLFAAAKRKLYNWKLTKTQVDDIIANGEPIETISVRSERSGYVSQKLVNLGDYIKAGSPIYEVTDLSSVWVEFDAYESDMQWISTGGEVEFTVSALPSKQFEGKITYIDPVINPKTRVSKVRVEVANPDHALKPEMFARGVISAELEAVDAITVPKSAVMWTGTRSVVYIRTISDQGNSFLMREVKLGPALGDQFVVEEGLESGDEIAVNGTFSIDAAAQLAGKPSMMSPEGGMTMTGHNHARLPDGQGGAPQSGITTDHSQHQSTYEVNESELIYAADEQFKKQLNSIFLAYLPMKDALIASDPKAAATHANAVLKATKAVDMTLVEGEAHMEWMKDMAVLNKTITAIIEEEDVEELRMIFSPLTNQLYQTLKKFEVETGAYLQFCPMAMQNKGAFWLSDSEKILNPYFGDAMLTCGNVEEELK